LLRSSEEKCTGLYQELISAGKQGVERWTDIQRKYEESQSMLQRQIQINEDMQGKLAEYKQMSAQVEGQWADRHE
jgi:hypothetical protein